MLSWGLPALGSFIPGTEEFEPSSSFFSKQCGAHATWMGCPRRGLWRWEWEGGILVLRPPSSSEVGAVWDPQNRGGPLSPVPDAWVHMCGDNTVSSSCSSVLETSGRETLCLVAMLGLWGKAHTSSFSPIPRAHKSHLGAH